MTEKQKRLIDAMNEFCSIQCDPNASTKEAAKYINDHFEEYKLLSADNFILENGYF